MIVYWVMLLSVTADRLMFLVNSQHYSNNSTMYLLNFDRLFHEDPKSLRYHLNYFRLLLPLWWTKTIHNLVIVKIDVFNKIYHLTSNTSAAHGHRWWFHLWCRFCTANWMSCCSIDSDWYCFQMNFVNYFVHDSMNSWDFDCYWNFADALAID